jgi:ribose transport system permease protein
MESTGSNSVSIDMVVKPLDRNIYNLLMIAIIIIIALIMTYVFNYTKLGKYSKAIGANEIVAAQSGINIIKWKVFAYLGFAVSIAIGSFMVLMRTGSAGNGTGTGYALDIMVCLILGGMPLSGGMKSKVSSAIIGVFIYVLLTNVLTTMGVDLKLISFVKAVIFLSIVLVTSRSKELVLPR